MALTQRQKFWTTWITVATAAVSFGVVIRKPILQVFGIQTVEATQFEINRLRTEQDMKFNSVYESLRGIQQSVQDVKGRQECDMLRISYDRCPAVIAEKNRPVGRVP